MEETNCEFGVQVIKLEFIVSWLLWLEDGLQYSIVVILLVTDFLFSVDDIQVESVFGVQRHNVSVLILGSEESDVWVVNVCDHQFGIVSFNI